MLLILEVYLTISAWKKGYKAWALLPWAACILFAIMIARAQGPSQTGAFNFALILPDLACVAVLAVMNVGRAKADAGSPIQAPGTETGQEMESPTSVLGSTAKNLILVLIVSCSLIGALTSYAQDEPVLMRMNLEPGETYRYQAKFKLETSEQGQEIDFDVACGIDMRILSKQEAGKSEAVTLVSAETSDAIQPLNIAQPVTEVEIEHRDFTMDMSTSGMKFSMSVGKDSVEAGLNGSPLPSDELAQLENDVKELQDLLRTPIRLSMLDSGQVVKVSGLENLGSDAQKEVAMGFFEAISLPMIPMKVGDRVNIQRSVASLFPKGPGDKGINMEDEKIEIAQTLQSIDVNSNGDRVAELTAPLKQTFTDVPLDENGTIGSVEVDVVYSSFFNLETGIMEKETAVGTVVLRPKDAGPSESVSVNLDTTIYFVEKTPSTTTASAEQED